MHQNASIAFEMIDEQLFQGLGLGMGIIEQIVPGEHKVKVDVDKIA